MKFRVAAHALKWPEDCEYIGNKRDALWVCLSEQIIMIDVLWSRQRRRCGMRRLLDWRHDTMTVAIVVITSCHSHRHSDRTLITQTVPSMMTPLNATDAAFWLIYVILRFISARTLCNDCVACMDLSVAVDLLRGRASGSYHDNAFNNVILFCTITTPFVISSNYY